MSSRVKSHQGNPSDILKQTCAQENCKCLASTVKTLAKFTELSIKNKICHDVCTAVAINPLYTLQYNFDQTQAKFGLTKAKVIRKCTVRDWLLLRALILH